MSIKDGPHFVISTNDLATWLERQGDQWWSVDNDPVLMEHLFLPCDGFTLAEFLRKLNRWVLVEDRRSPATGAGETIGPDELNALASRLNGKKHGRNARLFYFSWANSPIEWLLFEDLRTTESMHEEMNAAGEKD